MHDDRRWLKHPVLPRPPALPHFGPELRALIGLDPSDFDEDPETSEPSAAHADTELAANSDTLPQALVSPSGVQPRARGTRVVRTGT